MELYLSVDVEMAWMVRALQDKAMEIYVFDEAIDFAIPIEIRN